MPITTTQYSDVNINFTINPITGDLNKVVGPSSVVQSVMDLVQFNHYDKPFHPPVGSGIRALLFELADNFTAQLIGQEIQNVLLNYEPRATVLGVYVEADVENDGFNVTIEFSINAFTSTVTVNTFLARLR